MPERKRKPAPKDSGAGVLLLVFGILIGLALVVRLFIGGSAPEKPQSEQIEITVTEEKTSFWERLFGKEEPEETEPALPTETQPYPVSTATLGAMGDMLMHIQLISGKYNSIADLGEGNYDFSPIFKHLGDSVSGLDYAVANLETTFGGDRHPYQGNPTFNCPDQLAGNLKDAGFDMLLTVNNHCSDTLNAGIKRTLNTVRQAGLTTLGTIADSADFRKTSGYEIGEVDGIRIALVAFTKGMDNLGLPAGSEDCVNLLYKDYSTDYKKVDTDRIARVLRNISEEQPDITIAMVHWGSEYNDEISKTQEKIRKQLQEGGVDIIVGSHPHLVQKVDYDPIAQTLVAYSLGDFFGDGAMAGSNYGVILDLEVTRVNSTGETYLSGWEYVPIFTLKPEQSNLGGHRVVRIREAMERYELDFVGRITEATYGDMEYALERIEKRINPETEE
jgi:poly-gamma-glutamate synthesis protein (capsule biosynthesis protein)